jgi:hypothetical protein
MMKKIKEAFTALQRKHKRHNVFISGIVVLLFLSNLPFFNTLLSHRLFFNLSIFWLFIVYETFDVYFFLIFFTITFILVLLGISERAEDMGNIIFFILLFICVRDCISFVRNVDKND